MKTNKRNVYILIIMIAFIIGINNVYAACSQISIKKCENSTEEWFKCEVHTQPDSTKICRKSNTCKDGYTNQNGKCVADSSSKDNSSQKKYWFVCGSSCGYSSTKTLQSGNTACDGSKYYSTEKECKEKRERIQDLNEVSG